MNYRLQRLCSQIPRSRRRRTRRHTQEDLHILVLRTSIPRPVVPGREVKRVLLVRRGRGSGGVARSRIEGVDTAVVVVELHEDGVEGDVAIQQVVGCDVWVRALRGGGEVVGLRGVLGHQCAEAQSEGFEVHCFRFQVQVETVDYGVVEGAEGCWGRLAARERRGLCRGGHRCACRDEGRDCCES